MRITMRSRRNAGVNALCLTISSATLMCATFVPAGLLGPDGRRPGAAGVLDVRARAGAFALFVCALLLLASTRGGWHVVWRVGAVLVAAPVVTAAYNEWRTMHHTAGAGSDTHLNMTCVGLVFVLVGCLLPAVRTSRLAVRGRS